MPVIPNNVDWSATAAWIALVISIIGTIIGPIVTTILTNRYNMKLHRLTFQEKMDSERERIIRECISGIGLVLSFMDTDNLATFSRTFYNVYPYVPLSDWKTLDSFSCLIMEHNSTAASEMLPDVMHLLNGLLVTEQPKHH